MRLLVIGGSDAGVSAATRAREVNPTAEVTVLLVDAFPNYSICGLPFYLSGETPNWQDLAHRKAFEGIDVLTEHRAITIDPRAKTVVAAVSAERKSFSYDRLIIATGARPIRPPVPGVDLAGVYQLHTMEDTFRLERELAEGKSVVIVGAGYIGVEMADALTRRGLTVTLLGRSTVLPTVDPPLGRTIEAHLRDHGVTVYTDVELSAIERHETRLEVTGSRGVHVQADLVLLAAGVEPNAELGVAAGITTGVKRALRVNHRMETNLPDVYAAGDCVETWHRTLKRFTYLPLGTTAHKQGRVAGENAAGGAREFAGSLGTQVVKVFDLAVARTGLRDVEASRAGLDALTVETNAPDHKAYYPNSWAIQMRVTAERSGGRLLGGQLLGHWQSEIAKRIDVFATALFHDMNVDELNDLDLSYTPPFGSPWDPAQAAAQAWMSAQRTEATRRSLR
jgi:NADPH-dependent 2,4-dienoyl-CoA reductase/sulfur reductase-like enzyme